MDAPGQLLPFFNQHIPKINKAFQLRNLYKTGMNKSSRALASHRKRD
jgi:hypothetical protein